MSLLRRKILGINVTTSPKKIILEEIEKYLTRNAAPKTQSTRNAVKPLVIATPNPEQIIRATKEPHFADILNRADITLPDGIGLVWATRFLGKSGDSGREGTNVVRTPGVEFMEDLVRVAQERGVTIGLIGGTPGVAVKAIECLQEKYPKLAGWAEAGPLLAGAEDTAVEALGGAYWQNVMRKIQATHTGMVFVGLGAPKQEYFIEELRTQIPELKAPTIFMSVGGSFDILSGMIQRAPLIIRLIGLEWLWRLIQEPWRLQRQTSLITFAWMVFRDRWKKS